MKRLIYILSPSYSGSTIFDLALGTHPRVLSLGEVHRIAAPQRERIMSFGNRCSCGRRLHECDVWEERRLATFNRIGIRPTSDWVELGFGPSYSFFNNPPTPIFNNTLYLLHRLMPGKMKRLNPSSYYGAKLQWAFFHSIAEYHDKDVIVDSSKSITPLSALASVNPAAITVVRLIRDGRGVVHSNMKRGYEDARQATMQWLNQSRRLDAVIRRINSETITIKYEDFCTNPSGVVRSLLEKRDITTRNFKGDIHVENHHTIPGNQISRQGRLTPKLDESWKNSLSKTDLNTFDRVGGRLNRHYGYA